MAALWRPTARHGQAWTSLVRSSITTSPRPKKCRFGPAGAAVLVTNKAPDSHPLIESSAELRFVTVTATGFDCVDGAAARQKGIPVSNVPEYSTHSVAQFVFALLLELCQNVARHAEAVTAGEWTSQPDFALRKTPLYELAGKTMGIVGFGRIGRQVGEIARGFGMKVVASKSLRPSPSSE